MASVVPSRYRSNTVLHFHGTRAATRLAEPEPTHREATRIDYDKMMNDNELPG